MLISIASFKRIVNSNKVLCPILSIEKVEKILPIKATTSMALSIVKLTSLCSPGIIAPTADLKTLSSSKDIYGRIENPAKCTKIEMNTKKMIIDLNTEFLKKSKIPLSSPSTHSLIAASSRAASDVVERRRIKSDKAASELSVRASQRGLSGNLK